MSSATTQMQSPPIEYNPTTSQCRLT